MKRNKVLLSLLLMMTIGCNQYDPGSCPEVELQNTKKAKDWAAAKRLVKAAFISCSFQKRCVKSIDFEAESSECYGWWE